MIATPDTGLELYLQEPKNSGRAATLALSSIIHVLVAAGLVFVHFSASAPAASPWRSQAVLVVPALPKHALPKEAAPKKAPPRQASAKQAPLEPAIAPPIRAEARAFRAPVMERAREAQARMVDATPPAIAPPPVSAPVATNLLSIAPHLPVLPAPPMKTDNLSSAGAATVTAANGKLESAGFGTSEIAAHAAAIGTARANVGSFGATSVSTRPSADAQHLAAGGFGNASATASRAQSDVPRTMAETPIEILEKPKPKYTEEATRLRIEGEVLVETLFPASGAPRVLRVIRGLGHGLDENAEAAAQSIRFHPATRGGQPVDATAVVHIVFQIAF